MVHLFVLLLKHIHPNYPGKKCVFLFILRFYRQIITGKDTHTQTNQEQIKTICVCRMCGIVYLKKIETIKWNSLCLKNTQKAPLIKHLHSETKSERGNPCRFLFSTYSDSSMEKGGKEKKKRKVKPSVRDETIAAASPTGSASREREAGLSKRGRYFGQSM